MKRHPVVIYDKWAAKGIKKIQPDFFDVTYREYFDSWFAFRMRTRRRKENVEVDDGFSGKTLHRGTPHVLDGDGRFAERPCHPAAQGLEDGRPARIVFDNDH